MIPSRSGRLPPLVVVLGASGLIGSAVTAALAGGPVRLRVVARRPTDWAKPYRGVEAIAADLTRVGSVAEVVAGADAVINLVKHDGDWRTADEHPDSERANVGVLREVVEALGCATRGAAPPIVVYSGTTSQAGIPPERPLDGSERDSPVTTYDRQKVAAEQCLKQAAGAGVVRGISLRLPTVFGHGRTPASALRGVVGVMARRALDGRPLTMWHDGTVLRELVHTTDVAEAFVSSLAHAERLTGHHWLIGSDGSVPMGRLFSMIADEAAKLVGGPPVPVVTVEAPVDAPIIDFTSVMIDSSPFRTATGWKPRLPLREAVARTVAEIHHFTDRIPLEESPCTERSSQPYTTKSINHVEKTTPRRRGS